MMVLKIWLGGNRISNQILDYKIVPVCFNKGPFKELKFSLRSRLSESFLGGSKQFFL